ncbi:MAG: exodeoxyribonuclease V subunit alpha, partial [Deltaproteobacteria bacterium]|nr:exodeoxyribonuclease V subunit alpha [Deltaproteobacteria bacterium]
EELLRDGLGRLFAAPSPGGAGRAGGAAGGEVEGASPAEPDRQKLGAELAVRGRFTVISGGPGTGKTTTVKKILVLLLEQARRLHQLGRGPFPLRIGLLAPTGKAAARLSEAIHEGLAELEVRPRELLDHLPVEASTVHRALGVIPDRPTLFRHGPDNPLPLDVVVVDEASMVDFALMTKLVEAVPSRARLILLGDSDQLASVEAGAVLGDICRGAGAGAEAEAGAGAEAEAGAGAEAEAGSGSATWGRPAGGSEGQAIGDRVIQLTRGWRFGPQSGIGALARAVNGDRPDDALALLRGQRREQGAPEPEPGGHTDLRLLDGAPEQVLEEQLRPLVVAGYAAFLAAAAARRDAAAALAALGRFRVLCAHRRGRLGVEQLGRRIEGWLAAAGLIEPEAGSWYAGRPILVTRNDYVLRLFNGDTGVVVPAPEGGGSLHACFPGARPGEVRRLAPARLPPHETVFAMTVHKSQGSQFEEVLIVLPEQPSPVLTRELLYTAVTRAGTMVTLAGEEPVIRHAIGERVQRFSGLRGKLWGSTSGFDWALGFD